MPTGSLKLHITDLLNEPIAGRIDITFEPASSSQGGESQEAELLNDSATHFIISEIECRGGPGTLYTIRLNTRNFRTYAFFQLIAEQRINTASDSQIQLLVNPRRVRDIEAPTFTSLAATARRLLDSANMRAPETADRDLLRLTGSSLYDALGPLRKACLLNILAKARHASAANCLRFLQSLLVLRQDRCFCLVDSTMPEFLRKSDRFKSAPNTLHEPLQDFIREDSFKSKDAHANLQVTFMRHRGNGTLAADIDIDEASGIEHGFELIRNAVSQGRTNPYLIRELLLLSDLKEKTLNPGYRFVLAR